MNQEEITTISRELSKIYLENWLSDERNIHRKLYSLEECIKFFLSGYKTILKSLTNTEIFNQPINPLAYSAALIYANKYQKEDEYYYLDSYINEFIRAYKHALKEIEKDYNIMKKECFEEPKSVLITTKTLDTKNQQKRTYKPRGKRF